ncbi:MAG TPA: amidohydrolase family protein, partial [Candidatus Thermoplasmatota archaeon]|nr:amidohydrolase family protein [Candidatus Thermoplasmatota archaeon]
MLARGPLWRDGAFEPDRWIEVENGVLVTLGRGAPPRAPDVHGAMLPTFVDAHTHVADRLARGRVAAGTSLAEAVAPPEGLKHRMLAAATADEVVASARAALEEARAAGTGCIVDFREGGAAGVLALRDAARGAGVRALALGRPDVPGAALDDVLAAADGLGLSGLADVAPEEAARQARAARAAGKLFALHGSEGRREDVDAMLALRPDLVVHATHATKDDAARLADARVPVALCPRSNERLVGRLPDARMLLDAGVALALGTDNAMLHATSVLDELRAARRLLHGVRPEELLAAAVDAPRARVRL